MIGDVKQYFSRLRALFQENPRRGVLLLAIALFSFATLLSISLLSGSSRWHNLPLAFAGIMATLMLVYVLFYGHFFLDVPAVCFVLFPIYLLISSIWGQFDASVITPFLLAGMAIASYQFLHSSKLIREFLLLWLIALMIFAVILAGMYWREIISFDVGRIGGTLNNINIVAEFLCVGFAISTYFIFGKRWLALLPFVLFAVLGLLTGSKQFVIGAAVVVIVSIFLLFGKKRWYFSFLVVAGVIGLGILVLQLPMFDVIRERLLNLLWFFSSKQKQQDGSNIERMAMIIEAFYLFGKNPVFGMGKNAFVTQGYFGTYAHNTIANLASDFGLIGLLLFLIPWGAVFVGIHRNKTRPNPFRRFAWISIFLIIALSLARVLIEDKAYYLLMPLVLSAIRFNAEPSAYEIFHLRLYRGRLSYYGLRYRRKEKDIAPYLRKHRYKI